MGVEALLHVPRVHCLYSTRPCLLRLRCAAESSVRRVHASAHNSRTCQTACPAQVARPVPVAICAGAAHSCALTASGEGGVLLAWHSMDPALRVRQVGGVLAGRTVVAVSAGEICLRHP